MTDSCALYLSYIVASHPDLSHLLAQLLKTRPGPHTQILDIHDNVSGCQGIVYQPNGHLGSAGAKVLDLAEVARLGVQDESDDGASEIGLIDAQTPASGRRISDPSLFTPVTPTDRRRSVPSLASSITDPGTPLHSGLRSTELDRARSRIQGDTIRDAGVCSNDLWRSALRMLVLGRAILMQPPAIESSVSPLPPPPPPSPVDARSPRLLATLDLSAAFESSAPSPPSRCTASSSSHRRKHGSLPAGIIMTTVVANDTSDSKVTLADEPDREVLLGGLGEVALGICARPGGRRHGIRQHTASKRASWSGRAIGRR